MAAPAPRRGRGEPVRETVRAVCRALEALGVAVDARTGRGLVRPETLRLAKHGQGGAAVSEALWRALADLALLALLAGRRPPAAAFREALAAAAAAAAAAPAASARASRLHAASCLARWGCPAPLVSRLARAAAAPHGLEPGGNRALLLAVAWLTARDAADVWRLWREALLEACPLRPPPVAPAPEVRLPPPPPGRGVEHRCALALQLYRRVTASVHRLADAHACRAARAAAAECAQGAGAPPLAAADLALLHARRGADARAGLAARFAAWAAEARECARAAHHRLVWFRWARSAAAAQEAADREEEEAAAAEEDADEDDGGLVMPPPPPARHGDAAERWLLGDAGDEAGAAPAAPAGVAAALRGAVVGPDPASPMLWGAAAGPAAAAAARDAAARLEEQRRRHRAALRRALRQNGGITARLRVYQ